MRRLPGTVPPITCLLAVSPSRRRRLKDGNRSSGLNHALKAQPSGVEQAFILGLRSLQAARDGEHDHVDTLDLVRLVTWRHERLGHKHLAVRQHCLAAILQDHRGTPVVPIVNDLLDDVDIAGGNAFKEITGNKFGARQVASGTLACCRDARRQVEKHAVQMGVASQDRREKLAMSAANVDDPRERLEVTSFGNGLVAALTQGDHGTLKQGSLLRVCRQPVKPWAPEHLVEGWLSGADRMHELLEGKIGLAVDHTNEVTGTRLIGAQHGANLRQLKMAGQHFPNDPFGREKSHDTIKRVSI